MTLTSPRPQLSFSAIVGANLATLAVIWWGDWNIHAILIVYWLETGIVSAVYFAKINRAEGADSPENVRSWARFDGKQADRLIGEPNRRIADAVVSNFAGPWLVFGLFFVLAGYVDLFDNFDGFEPASPETVALATGCLLAYHVFSYWFDYLGLEAYRHQGPVSLFTELAPRHLAMVLTWIFGMAVASVTRNPMGAAVVLVFLKTFVDLVAHRRERALARV